MAIRAVILDVSGTLIDEATSTVVPGVPEMLDRLRAQGIAIFAASNEVASTALAESEFGIERDHLLNPVTVGGKKGTRKYFGAIRARFGMAPNQLLYLGDSINDWTEAINSGIAFFPATWSASTVLPYGIPVSSPAQFADMVETYFLKQAFWYYSVDGRDGQNRPVAVRALMSNRKAEESGIKNILKGINQSWREQERRKRLIQHLSLHLLASIYLEGLYLPPVKSGVIWALYPSHDGPQTGILDAFASMASRMFRANYQNDIIERHTPAEKLAFARARGEKPLIDVQLQSIRLNVALRGKLADKVVLLIDDFSTHAHGFETARNFLLNAGVSHVISIAVGKFPSQYLAYSPKPGVQWDSYAAINLTQDSFITTSVEETRNQAALEVFDSLI